MALAGELAVMIVTRGKQGPLRDWDNQVGPALVVTLVTAYALVAFWRRSGMARSALPVCVTALVMGVALWGIHASAGIGERRVATLLTDPAAWNTEEWAQAHDFIGQRAFNAGRYDEAARAYGIAAARVPSPRMLDNVAVALSMAGRDEEARDALARAMTVPQGSAAMWVALARVAETLGDSARAAVCMDSARSSPGPGRGGPRPAAGRRGAGPFALTVVPQAAPARMPRTRAFLAPRGLSPECHTPVSRIRLEGGGGRRRGSGGRAGRAVPDGLPP